MILNTINMTMSTNKFTKKMIAMFGLSILLLATLAGCGTGNSANSDGSNGLLDELFGGDDDEGSADQTVIEEEMPQHVGPAGPPSFYMDGNNDSENAADTAVEGATDTSEGATDTENNVN